MRIAEITDENVEAVVALWRACGLTRPWNDPHRDIALARASPAAAVLAARHDDGVLVGTVMIGFDGHRGWVYYLGVAPETRGRGVGRALMAEAEQRLAVLGAPKIQLMVRSENAAARGFYSRLGYDVQDTAVLGRWLGESPRRSTVERGPERS